MKEVCDHNSRYLGYFLLLLPPASKPNQRVTEQHPHFATVLFTIIAITALTVPTTTIPINYYMSTSTVTARISSTTTVKHHHKSTTRNQNPEIPRLNLYPFSGEHHFLSYFERVPFSVCLTCIQSVDIRDDPVGFPPNIVGTVSMEALGSWVDCNIRSLRTLYFLSFVSSHSSMLCTLTS